jgi:hypothetical protein
MANIQFKLLYLFWNLLNGQMIFCPHLVSSLELSIIFKTWTVLDTQSTYLVEDFVVVGYDVIGFNDLGLEYCGL